MAYATFSRVVWFSNKAFYLYYFKIINKDQGQEALPLLSEMSHTPFKGRVILPRNGKEASSWVAQKANWEEHWRMGNTEEIRKDRFSNRKKPPSREAKGLRCACPCYHPDAKTIENTAFFPFWRWLSGSSKLLLKLYLLKTQAEYHNDLMAHGALRLQRMCC